jgi:hypothetical protein
LQVVTLEADVGGLPNWLRGFNSSRPLQFVANGHPCSYMASNCVSRIRRQAACS